MSNYLSEAFKKLDILDEDIFEVDKDGLTALKDFEDSDDEEELITVVDPDAEDEEELEDSYIGKVILDCSVCHTDIYKDKEDITIDDESGLANIGEECPYCYSSEGFKVIGEVKPFVEVEFDTDDVEVEVDGEKNESLLRKNRRLKESKKLNEWTEPGAPFSNICSIDEWNAFKNGELLFDLDSEEFVSLDAARNNKLERCLEYDSYEDYGEKVKNGMVSFLMYDPGDFYYIFDDEDDEEYSESLKRHRRVSEAVSRKGLKESCSINQCQKWVDYDMKKYKKISSDTMEKIKSSGYSVVKDQYGDYEVIANRKDTSKNEACSGKRKSRKFEEAVSKENNKRFGAVAFENGKQVDSAFSDREEDIARWIGDNYYFFDTIKVINNLDGKSSEMKVSFKKNDPSFVLKQIVSAFKQAGIEYSLNKRFSESLKRKIKKIMESIEDITIDTGDQEITVSAKDKEEVESDGEMIAPLSDEVKADIETGSDDTVDVDVDEFSEEDFDELGESYLKKVYENVESYKTTSAKTKGNKLYLEGLIKFNSGKQKKTSFVFESKTITKTGKAKLIGENLQISRGHKSFKLTGTINNGKFISESLNYNYRVKNGNESQRVYGTARKSK